MIKVGVELARDIPSWHAVRQNVVGRLDVEGLFNLGIRSQIQMQQRQQGKEAQQGF